MHIAQLCLQASIHCRQVGDRKGQSREPAIHSRDWRRSTVEISLCLALLVPRVQYIIPSPTLFLQASQHFDGENIANIIFFTASDTFRHSKLSPSRNFSFQFVSASKHTNILRNLFIILVIKTFAYLELCKMRNFVLPKVSRKFRVQFASSGTFPLCPPFLLYRGKNNQNHFSLF